MVEENFEIWLPETTQNGLILLFSLVVISSLSLKKGGNRADELTTRAVEVKNHANDVTKHIVEVKNRANELRMLKISALDVKNH